MSTHFRVLVRVGSLLVSLALRVPSTVLWRLPAAPASTL